MGSAERDEKWQLNEIREISIMTGGAVRNAMGLGFVQCALLALILWRVW